MALRRCRRLAQVLGILGLAVLAYGWGRYGTPARVTAAPPAEDKRSFDRRALFTKLFNRDRDST